MKLAKKMLVCLMAIALVAVMGVMASASTITVDTSKIEVGKEGTVALTAADFNGTYSGNISVKYDASKVEYVNATAVNGGVAGNPEAGLVTLAFMDMNSYSDATATLLTITFKGIAAGDPAIAVEVDSWDGEGPAATSPADAGISIGKIEVVEAPSEVESTTAKEVESTTAKEVESTTAKEVESTTKKVPQPADETTTKEVIPAVEGDEIIVKEGDFINGKDLAEKDAACEKAAAAAKDAKGAKGAKAAVAQTGDTAVALIAGIMAIGAVGFIATKKKEEI